MFDFVQNNKAVQFGMKVLLGAIAISFVGFGAGSFLGDGRDEVAKVGDTSITRQEVQRALQQRDLGQDKAEEMTQSLIQRQLLLEKARESGVTVTDEELAKALAAIPIFQKDGQFNLGLYNDFLASRRTSSAVFESRFRDDLIYERMQQLSSQMTAGGFYAKTAHTTLSQYLSRQREVSSVRIEAASFMDKVQVSDQDVAAYYQSNDKEFRLPDQVRVEYILLTVPMLASGQTVSDEEVKTFFDKNKQQFERDERKARHILLTMPEKANAAAKAAVKAKAELLLQDVKNNPERFADIAKQHSQDPGSAAQGGDLGWMSRQGLDATFANALFAMQANETSNLVETQFGYHIIHLDGVRKTGLEESRMAILEKLKEQKARKVFPTLSEEMGELAVETEKNLVPVAQKLKLPLQTTDWFSRNGQENDPVFSSKNKDVLDRIFSVDGLAGRASEVIELPEQQRLLTRVIERKPARLQALAEVSAAIRAKLQAQGAAKLAEAEGKRQLQALQKGEALPLKWSEAQKVGIMQAGMLSRDVVKQLMAVPSKDVTAFSGIVERGGYTLFKVGKFVDTMADPRLAEELEKQRLMGEGAAYDKMMQRELLQQAPAPGKPAV